MSVSRCKGLALAAVLLASRVGASDRPEAHVFVACPVYRDTNNGRKSGCWLATEPSTGIRFDISQSRTKPQLGHAALIEAIPSDSQEQPCGGRALLPVQVSVLAATCPSVLIPAEGFPGRQARVDPRSVLPPADTTRALPQPPFATRTWSIEFAYASDFLQYQYSEVILDEIARYIVAGQPRRVNIRGFAVTAPQTVDSVVLREPRALARARAEMVAEALRRLRVPPRLMTITTHFNPPESSSPGALPSAGRRRVEIEVLF